MSVMAYRALFSVWFFFASVFAPALCCCAPFAVRSASASPVAVAAEPPATEHTCPHCKPAARPRHETPADQAPCPSHPTKDNCPCKERSAAQVTAAVPDVRPVVVGDWLSDLVLFSPAPVAFAALTPSLLQPPDHTGPPPPSGVELLHRLHILIC